MKLLVLPLIFLLSAPAFAQQSTSLGRKKVDAAYKFQEKLKDSSVTIEQVIQNWRRTAADTDVQKDRDSYAVALGCEGYLELQRGNDKRADSILDAAMLKFRRKSSKAFFLVTFAELERELKHYHGAMSSYEEIVNTMDSLPQLWDIAYYRLSGYAPYAYAIDACYGMAQIATADKEHRKYAIELLTAILKKHPSDALGLMALTALHELNAINDEGYKFKLDFMASRHPQLRAIAPKFEKQFASTAAQETGKRP
jgi:hypothetical protein